MGTDLLYDTSEEYKNKQLIFDFERGEVIDPQTGIVLEDHLPVDTPNIRANDYAEWESKKHHEIFVDEKERKLRGIVYSVGRRVNAPRWVCDDVLMFLKSAVKVKASLVLGRNTSFSIFNEKLVLATFYVIAKKRGLVGLAETIGKMKCDSDIPCYESRRRKDREFHKYLLLILKLWFVLYRDNSYSDEIKNYVRYFASIVREVDGKIDIVRVSGRATELLSKSRNVGSFKPRNFAAAIVVASIANVYGEKRANDILRALVKEYNVNETSVRNILRRLSHLENGGGE